jgi:hypothetical protein
MIIIHGVEFRDGVASPNKDVLGRTIHVGSRYAIEIKTFIDNPLPWIPFPPLVSLLFSALHFLHLFLQRLKSSVKGGRLHPPLAISLI